MKTLKGFRRSQKRALINRMRKSEMKTNIKKFVILVGGVKIVDDATRQNVYANFSKVQSCIMKNAGKGIIPQNRASRRVSKLAYMMKKALHELCA